MTCTQILSVQKCDHSTLYPRMGATIHLRRMWRKGRVSSAVCQRAAIRKSYGCGPRKDYQACSPPLPIFRISDIGCDIVLSPGARVRRCKPSQSTRRSRLRGYKAIVTVQTTSIPTSATLDQQYTIMSSYGTRTNRPQYGCSHVLRYLVSSNCQDAAYLRLAAQEQVSQPHDRYALDLLGTLAFWTRVHTMGSPHSGACRTHSWPRK